ncbi:MAG: RNA methyltransferase [Planctomycetaceae bacterium]|nr:RNA methyltransferase [Planctomycetaceae bacterium]
MEDVAIDDPRLDPFRGVRDRELRGTLGLHAIESERVVRRFLTASLRRRAHPAPPRLEPLALLVTPDAAERLADITAHFPALAVYRCADEKALHEITGYTMHSGAIALGLRHEDGTVGEFLSWLAREQQHAARDVVVALDGITQTDNVGAIFRNAASFGARGVLLSPRASDPFLRKTLRVSMGRAVALPWARADDDEWPSALERMRREQGYAIIAAEDAPEAVELAGFRPPARAVVVFGAEQDGVSRAVLELADAVVKIPMRGAASPALEGDPPSLNVSIASAVVLHHLLA